MGDVWGGFINLFSPTMPKKEFWFIYNFLGKFFVGSECWFDKKNKNNSKIQVAGTGKLRVMTFYFFDFMNKILK